jgi:hypothetical protein
MLQTNFIIVYTIYNDSVCTCPLAPLQPPCIPYGSNALLSDSILTVSGCLNIISRNTPSPPRYRPAPPEPMCVCIHVCASDKTARYCKRNVTLECSNLLIAISQCVQQHITQLYCCRSPRGTDTCLAQLKKHCSACTNKDQSVGMQNFTELYLVLVRIFLIGGGTFFLMSQDL